MPVERKMFFKFSEQEHCCWLIFLPTTVKCIMSSAQKNQFEQQYNDALGGENAANKIPAQQGSKIKDPEDWTTGNEPMTEAQKAYLKSLMELHGEPFNENLTKADAAELIDSKKQNIIVPTPNDVPEDFWKDLKNPDNWRTGDEPATASQLSYLKTLATEAGENIDENLTKAEASKRIEELQQKTGRGLQQS